MINVNMDALEACIDGLATDLRGAMVAIDIWDPTLGLSLTGRESNPAATALFNQITSEIQTSLADAGFAQLKDYYLMSLEGDQLVVIMRASSELMAGMLVDGSRANLGLLVGVAIPKVIKAMKDSIVA